MPDGIDTWVQPMQAVRIDSPLDRPAPEPEGKKLPSRDHPMLPLR
jgi:hypothetical protein